MYEDLKRRLDADPDESGTVLKRRLAKITIGAACVFAVLFTCLIIAMWWSGVYL